MLATSGVLVAAEELPLGWSIAANMLPTTPAITLLEGVWKGAGWGAHWANVLALIVNFVLCIALSARVFRWE